MIYLDLYSTQPFKIKKKFMSVTINYSSKLNNKASSNTIFFVDEKFSTNHIKNYLSKFEQSYISDLFKEQ